MEKAIERQRVLLHHLRPSFTSSSLENIDSSLSASICAAGDSAAYHRSSVYGDDVVIVAAYRTALCKSKRGGFKDTHPDDLLAPVLRALIEKTNLNPSEVGDIVVGTVLAPGSQRASECRMAAFYAGFPETVPIRTVNRQCSSGLQAVADVAAAIKAGFYDIGIGAGLESMTANPMAWEGSVNPKVKTMAQAQDCLLPMGVTSENVAHRFSVTRQEQDQAAVESHRKAAAATASGKFKEEIIPVDTKIVDPKTGDEKPVTISVDDGIRPNATISDLAKLKPVFKKDGTTTAGNSSQVSDGAGAVLLMKRSIAMQKGLPILGVFRTFAAVGVDPAIMGVGPSVAIPAAVKAAGLELDDIDLFEINEAFASQFVYCRKKLELDPEKINVNGGAMAIGHPLGATGARCVATLLHEMKRRGKDCRFGVISMCIGTGALANGGGEGPDWQDFAGIICLLIINSTISFIEENNAGNAAAALMARLAPKTKVLRDGRWQEQDASVLVPGDIISIKLGDIIPADARLLEGDPLKIDQSALTGESLPVTKRTGDEVFSGSTCKQGEIEAVVIATGVHSFFGKAAHLVDSTESIGHFQKVLTAIGNFCICSIAVGMILEIIVMYPIQLRSYRDGINNLLVLLIGGIPIAMPTVLSVTLAIGSHRLSQQGAITKRMTAIEEMAGMDVLCSDKTGTLTLNRLTVDRNLIEVFNKDMDKDMIVLLAARASRLENQDAIDTAIVNMLADPKEARANITEVHFLPFNPVDKRTAITYIDSDGNWYRASKGSPEQILNLSEEREEIAGKVHAIIDKFAERGLRSLGVALQEVPERSKDGPGGPWKFCGLLPLFDPPRHDSAETIRRALNLGVCVKMITGDQLAIAKETGRRLGMGTNMYPSSSLLGRNRDENEVLPVDELIEKADGFAGVFPEHKYEIVKILQEKKHVVGMTGDGVNDAPALKKADIGIAVADATDAARSASDIVLTEPGLSVIISAVLTSRAIFQRMKNYTIYAVSITIRIVLGFMLLALIWEYDFPPFMVLIIAILNDGTIMTISKDRVKPSPKPDSWKLNEIFATGVVIGTYLALITVLFYWVVGSTSFFENHFGVESLSSTEEISSAMYLQVSVISQALIFVTRSQSWSFMERPGILLMCAFVVAQLVATLIAVYATISFASISGIGWGWAGVIWLYSVIFYIPLDIIKFAVRYALSGEAWNLLFDRKTAFTSKKDYGKEDREAKWVLSQRTLQGLMSGELEISRRRSNLIAEQARRRAEIARLGELHTLRGHVESVVRLKNLDTRSIQTAHTV